MKHIRQATEEEVQSIASGSDLEQPYTVLALESQTEKPHFAVIKQVVMLDPIWFAPESKTNDRARFVWGLEERIRGAGIGAYYFNVNAEDTAWQRVIETWGAQRVSPAGTVEIQYKKRLP